MPISKREARKRLVGSVPCRVLCVLTQRQSSEEALMSLRDLLHAMPDVKPNHMSKVLSELVSLGTVGYMLESYRKRWYQLSAWLGKDNHAKR